MFSNISTIYGTDLNDVDSYPVNGQEEVSQEDTSTRAH